MSSFGAVKERTFELMETGEYCFTLNDLTQEQGQYGDSLKWVWLLAPKDNPEDYICRNDGMEKTLFAYTDQDIIIGSQQHEWVQILSGRKFEDGDEPPEDSDLLGKRMIAYLTHQAPKKGPNAGKLREKIVAGSAKTFRGRHATVAPLVEAPIAPTTPDVPDDYHSTVVAAIKKELRKAAVLDVDTDAWNEIDLGALVDDDLDTMLRTIKAAIKDASAVAAAS